MISKRKVAAEWHDTQPWKSATRKNKLAVRHSHLRGLIFSSGTLHAAAEEIALCSVVYAAGRGIRTTPGASASAQPYNRSQPEDVVKGRDLENSSAVYLDRQIGA